MDKKNKKTDTVNNGPQNMDNPEQYRTNKESLHDKFESEQTVDPIPMEDLKQEKREEKNGHHTKDSSSSEEKYNVDYDNDL